MPHTSYAVGGPQNSAGVLESRGGPPKPQELRFSRFVAPRGLARALSGPGRTLSTRRRRRGCDPSGVRRPRATCSPKSRSEPHPDTRWDGARRPQSERAGEAAGAAAQDFPIQNDLLGRLGGWDAAPGYWRLFRSRPWTWIPRATQLHTAGCRGTGCLGGRCDVSTFETSRRGPARREAGGGATTRVSAEDSGIGPPRSLLTFCSSGVRETGARSVQSGSVRRCFSPIPGASHFIHSFGPSGELSESGSPDPVDSARGGHKEPRAN